MPVIWAIISRPDANLLVLLIVSQSSFADHRCIYSQGHEQTLDIDPVLFAANHDVKIKILEQGIEVIKNPLPGVKNDPGARPDMVKVGEMMDDQEKTNGGKVSTPLLLEDAGIITHKVDL